MQVGTKLRSCSGANGYRGILHWCPGCEEVHQYKIAGPGPTCWSFDGNFDSPTLLPSMRISDNTGTICHYFIRAGKIEFCGDSPHKLKGQTVDLPDWPYAPGTYGGVDE